jgi:hypothetical protein
VRKLVLIGLTVAAALLAAAVALAQTPAPEITSMDGKVTPKNAGTKKKPKNGYVHIKFTVNQESKSTLRRIEYSIPKVFKLDGKGFPTCSADTIGSQGESACPKGSLVGTGAADVSIGGSPTQSLEAHVYVAARKTILLSLTGFTSAIFEGQISGGKVGFDIPDRVQNPTGGPAGPYSYVLSVTADLGKQSGIKASTGSGKHKRYFVSSTGCKGKHYTLGVEAFLAANPDPPPVPSISKSTDVACQK